jgi:hypothetical protein
MPEFSIDDDYDCSRLKAELMAEFDGWDDDAQPLRGEVFKGEVKSPSGSVGFNFRFGKYELVGHGKQSSDLCGRFAGILGCGRTEFHKKTVFDPKTGSLVNFADKGDFRPFYVSCHSPRCPVCYERGWAVREADNINFRLEEASKRLDHVAWGEIEHFIVAVPLQYYGFSLDKIRKLTEKALLARGIHGCIIEHGARFDFAKGGWYWSPHIHVLGFVRHGMRKCRGCVHCDEKGSRFFCDGCSGFYGLSKKLYRKDRFIVEVKGKRKSVFGTAWYQLHHCTVRVDRERCHVVTWFGLVSYRKMKIPKEAREEYDEKRKPKCRICGMGYSRYGYVGHDAVILGLMKKRRGAREKVEPYFDWACDYVESPEPSRRRWCSGSYE